MFKLLSAGSLELLKGKSDTNMTGYDENEEQDGEDLFVRALFVSDRPKVQLDNTSC